MKRTWFIFWAVAMAWAGGTAQARINVVTLPGRDSVQLTIYNSVDLTLVKETRLLVFRQGLNRLEFSWANTLIDPTSVEFRALTHRDEVEVLDVSFPPRVTNTLEWRIQSSYAGELEVEIRYFTSGIHWAADYVAETTADEKQMTLDGFVRVNNQSGEDYENAQVRLVVGVIRLVEDIARLAQAGRPGAMPPPTPPPAAAPTGLALRESLGRAMARGVSAAEGKPREIVKEGFSEYFLYTVEGRDTIANGWAKRLPSFQAKGVPVTSYYKFEPETWGGQVVRYYRFTNNVASHLGKEPLPDGGFRAFRLASRDQSYAYVGQAAVKYIPIKEQVEVELGADQEVLVKPTLMNWEKTNLRFDQQGDPAGWSLQETWQVEAQNSSAIDVVLDFRRTFAGDWSLVTRAPYEKVDAQKVKFTLRLKPREKQSFTYQVTTRYGLNATR